MNKTKVDSQFYLANLLLKWSSLANIDELLPSWKTIEKLLNNAQKHAEMLNYEKGIVYAIGDLGQLY